MAGTTVTGTRVVVNSRLGSVDRDAWARFSANLDARLDPRWFLLNDGEIAQSSYVSVWQHDHLRALAPCLVSRDGSDGFVPHRATDALFFPERIHGSGLGMDQQALMTAGEGLRKELLFPSLAVATPCSAYAPVSDLLWPSGSDLTGFQYLVTAIDQLAERVSARLWAILGIPAGSPLLAYAAEAGFLPALIAADTTMEVQWRSFDDYLGSLGSRRRYSIRWELTCARERGVELALAPNPLTIVDDQVRVARSRIESPGDVVDVETDGWYIRETIHRFGPDYRTVYARRNGELIGFCSFISNGRHHKVLDCCVDPSKTERSDHLFSALMSEVVRTIIALHGGTVTFGATNYRAKLHRGCSLQLLWGLYKPIEPSLRSALADYLSVFNRLQSDCFEPLRAFENPPRHWRV